jgi:hypothetical protein
VYAAWQWLTGRYLPGLRAPRERDPAFTRIIMAGAALALTGFFLPWEAVRFAPPGGTAVVNGSAVRGFSASYDGLNSGGSGPGRALQVTVLVLFFIALYDLAGVLLPDRGYPRRWVSSLASLAKSQVGGKILGVVQAVVHVVQALAILGLIFLTVALGKVAAPMEFAGSIGGGTAAVQASRYFSIGLGTGFWLMAIGILVAGILIARRVAGVLLLLLAVVVVVAIGHHAWLLPLLRYLGF